jgi:hypothetical protein
MLFEERSMFEIKPADSNAGRAQTVTVEPDFA